jgi:site-specific DNA recombinase
MNGIIYCRVSTKEQIGGTSLESQESSCRDYAKVHGINVLRAFIERGESAKFADRTQLLELINFCKGNQGNVHVLLVWKVDRFARNVGDHFSVKAGLKKYGVDVVSVTEPIDGNPEGKLLETMLAGFAQFDNDVRAMRTVQGMRRKIREGISPWHPPLGYKSCTSKREKKIEPDVPDESLFSLLQRAWREFATGNYTKAEMRRLMEHWGIETRRGMPLSPQSVDDFFRNPYYAGVLTDPWSGEEFPGRHEKMVTSAEFASVQKIISGRSPRPRHQKERPEFPLRGFVRCSQCGRLMTGSFSRGRSQRYPYYRCYKRGCVGPQESLPVGDVHLEFEAFLKTITITPTLRRVLPEALAAEAQRRTDQIQKQGTHIEREIQKIDQQIRELIRMRASGLLTDDEFRAQKIQFTSRRHSLQARTNHDAVDADDIREHLAEIEQPLSAPAATWQAMTLPEKRRFQQILFPVGFLHGRIGTAEKARLCDVLSTSSDSKSDLVPQTLRSWNRLIEELQRLSEFFRGRRC